MNKQFVEMVRIRALLALFIVSLCALPGCGSKDTYETSKAADEVQKEQSIDEDKPEEEMFSSIQAMDKELDIFDLDIINTRYYSLDRSDCVAMEKAKWANHGMFGCDFIRDNVRFDCDHMELWLTDARKDSQYEYEYSGAEFRTRVNYGYGMYAVKMKPAKNPGIVSSFFTYTSNEDKSNWDEIDIEFLGYDTTIVQFNFYSNGVGKHEHIYQLGFDASEEYHEYGFLWLNDRIVWCVDETPVYTVTSEECEIPDTPGKIMMNLWNGDNSDSIVHWLGEYDGTTDIHADYLAFVYTPVLR